MIPVWSISAHVVGLWAGFFLVAVFVEYLAGTVLGNLGTEDVVAFYSIAYRLRGWSDVPPVWPACELLLLVLEVLLIYLALACRTLDPERHLHTVPRILDYAEVLLHYFVELAGKKILPLVLLGMLFLPQLHLFYSLF